KGQILRKCPVAVHDAEHGPIQTVVRHFELAIYAVMTDTVDFADDPLTIQLRIVRRRHHPYKFVAEYAGESHVTVHDFHVGIAKAGVRHAQQSLAGARLRGRQMLDAEFAIEDQCAHYFSFERSQTARRCTMGAACTELSCGYSTRPRRLTSSNISYRIN